MVRRLVLGAALLAYACRSGDAAAPGPPGVGGSDPPAPSSSSPTSSPAAPKIVFVTDVPSHGPGEHEYFAGGMLLAKMLEQSPEAQPTAVVRGGFPDDPRIFDGARAIVFITNGRTFHPLDVAGRADILDRSLARGVGLAFIHWSTDIPATLAARADGWMGGYAVDGSSVYTVWHPTFDALPDHPITRGVPSFDLDDEWYFGLRFVADTPRILPILRAAPPDALRATPDTAAHPGQVETLAWTFERADGGRSFGYTGAHYHDRYARPEVRRLVVNAILWIANLDVPAGGAPVEMDPSLITENLDVK